MKGIIPTGGRGTRMRPITFSANKHFIPVGNKPLIFYPIEAVVGAGIKNIAITYNPGYLDLVKNHLGSGKKWSAKFTYILQPEPKGLANVIEICEDYMQGEPFVYHLGDNIFTKGIKMLADRFVSTKTNALLSVIHHPENFRMGVPYFDQEGKLIKYVEKPKNPPHDYAIPGVYFFDHQVFACFKGRDKIKPSARGELEIVSPFNWLIEHGYRVETMEYPHKWLDPGKFDDWLDTNRCLLDMNIPENHYPKLGRDVKLEGRVEVGENSEIKNSLIRGPVSLGKGVVIRDSYVGPYTSIANNCQILSARVENSVLMEGVTLEKLSKPVESSLIGPGTVVSGNDNSLKHTQLFVGEESRISL